MLRVGLTKANQKKPWEEVLKQDRSGLTSASLSKFTLKVDLIYWVSSRVIDLLGDRQKT
jgi:hypothetical protein